MSRNGENRWGWGQRCARVMAVLFGLLLAGYGALGSYGTVTDLAASKGLPLPELVPVGVDGGLFGVMVLEIVLTWTGQPLGLLRQVVRLLTFGTVAANAAAGWPDPVAVGLHIAAPVMLLVMLEAARTVLLRHIGIAAGTMRERIPLTRWLLAPWPTWLLWRRMVLWQITSYHTAIDLEHYLRYATALLRARHGRGWRRTAPAEVVWKLTNAITLEEARTAVAQLAQTGTEDAVASAAGELRLLPGGNHSSEQPNPGQPHCQTARESATSRNAVMVPVAGPEWQEAVQFNEQHWAAYGRPASIEKIRAHLHVGKQRAQTLARAIRERDCNAVCGSPALLTTGSPLMYSESD